MKNLLIQYMMFIPGVILLSISAIGFAVADEGGLLMDATELYKFDDAFGKAALLYRPTTNPGGLGIFDLQGAIITLIKHGPPANCMELIISSPDGAMFVGCEKNVNIDRALDEMHSRSNK